MHETNDNKIDLKETHRKFDLYTHVPNIEGKKRPKKTYHIKAQAQAQTHTYRVFKYIENQLCDWARWKNYTATHNLNVHIRIVYKHKISNSINRKLWHYQCGD